MKKTVYLFLLISISGFAQNKNEADSLIRLLPTLPNDTNKVWMLERIANIYGNIQADSGSKYAQKGLDLAQKLQFKKGEVMCLSRVGSMYRSKADFTTSLQYQIKALRMAETIEYKLGIRKALGMINGAYRDLGSYDLALTYNYRILKLAEEMNDDVERALRGMGETYLKMNMLDSALFYTQKAYRIVKKDNIVQLNMLLANLGEIYSSAGNYPTAINYYRESIPYSLKTNNIAYLSISHNGLALIYQKLGKRDSCIYFAKKALDYATESGNIIFENKASIILASAYDTIVPLKALMYYKLAASTQKSISNQERIIEFQKLSLDEQRRQQEIEAEKERYNNRLWRYGLLFGLVFVAVIAFILLRNNQHKQQTNLRLLQQKDQIEHTLTELKATQNQLIQKEKLASLGELTAGIAHEIQNPLNFVNNFSEMSVELAQELKEEAEKPEIDKELIIDLATDLAQNQQKINHHGKRAAGIVSSMLEHSRTSTGERAMTDINKLADEYLRLSYHGMRAKYKNFNADYELIADGSLPLISCVPQDIGRVLLNLINNAFYAVNVGENLPSGVKPAVELLADVKSPKVIVKTEHTGNQLIIQVKDNGSGMSKEVQEKIFQPFFTTKPTGEGTGLGLSLTYDIVVKGHGGTIDVESVEGEGTTFTVKLPIQTA